MTIMDACPTFEIEAFDGDAVGLVLIDVNFCRRCDSFCLCQRSRSLTGLCFVSLKISSQYLQQKLGLLRGAPKNLPPRSPHRDVTNLGR